MNKNNSFQEIWNALKKCKRVAMTLHRGPDGDSLGSCIALKYVLERDLKCAVTLVSYDALDDTLMQTPLVHGILFGTDVSDLDAKEFDAIILMDSGSYEMMSGKLREKYVLPKDTVTINIDHHHTNTGYGTLKYINPEESSTCSILLDLFREMRVSFDARLSTALLLGICTDTGFFAHGNNPRKYFGDVVFLMDHGAEYIKDIAKPIRGSRPLKLKKYQAMLIDHLQEKREGKERFAYSIIPWSAVKKLGLNSAEVRLGISAISDIQGFSFVFTLVEEKDQIKGSFRSQSTVDVSVFAKALGGGGHKSAAAFFLPKMPLKRAENKVLAVIKRIRTLRQ